MLKNKDGTVYKLRTPNYLAKEQIMWGKNEPLTMHNFDKWLDNQSLSIQEKSVVPEPIIIPKEEVSSPLSEKDLLASEKQVEEVMPALANTSVPQEPPKIEQKSIKIKEKNICIMHCLPAIIEEHKDELYDEVKRTMRYGEKFTFEAVVIQRSDLVMSFWTNIKLEERTIIYPKVYKDGTKFGDFRWWQISSMQEKSQGYLYETIVADYQPDFS